MGFRVIGIQKCQKNLLVIFFCIFEPSLWIFELLWKTNFWFFLMSSLVEFQLAKYYPFPILEFSVWQGHLKSNFSWSVQDIHLKFLGLSYLIYCKNLANFYQIEMSHVVQASKIVSFGVEWQNDPGTIHSDLLWNLEDPAVC